VKPIRVLVADDHPATRAGVRSALEDGGFIVCAEVADGAAAIEAAVRERPDICLLDIHMPGSGIAAAAEISAQVPETAIIMLTVSQADEDLFAALRAGAAGYLLKDTNPARLPLALEGVLRGESAVPRVLVGRLIEEFRGRERRRRIPLVKQPNAKLTSREWEVLELMREGFSTADIADRLYISRVTVRSHIAAILHKLRVPDRRSALKLFEEAS
jgi:DNA-binding NarL/FixJ family response regulator